MITKLTTDHWSKSQSHLDTSLVVYLFFDSDPYLGRCKESGNQGIKVQVKRPFKSYSYLSHTHAHRHTKQTGSAWNFSEPWVLVCSRCLNLPLQNQCPVFCSFSTPSQDQQNGKDWDLLSQCFRITLKEAYSNISINPIGLSFLLKFYFLTNLYIPP